MTAMCQAIPRRVLRIDGSRIEVDHDGRPTWVDATGLGDLAVGDHVVVYAGRALERMDPEDVEVILGFYAGLEAMLAEASR